MTVAFLPSTYDSHNINSSPYEARFPANDAAGLAFLGNWPSSAVDTERTGQTPQFVRHQPQSRDIVVEIVLRAANNTWANVTQLKDWFAPRNDPAYLVATDGSTTIRLPCIPITCVPVANNPNGLWRITLHLTGPAEDSAATTGSVAIIATGQTQAIVNAGSEKAYPTFTLTPNTVMAHADSWIRRRRVVIANRSELPWTDPVGDGWPVDLTENAWDTDALNTASKMLTTLNDARVVMEGAEQNRWMDPAGDDTTTKTWMNLQMRARKTATLAVNINNSVATLSASNANGFFGWPSSGFLVMDTECIQYTARTATALTIVRGSRNTTAAAHTAGATMYWVEHPFLDIIYDYTAATDPAPPDDRKPGINLASSTNSLFVWNANFINATDRRSAMWQPMRTDDGPTSDWITLAELAGKIRFQDIQPTATKPNFNNLYLDPPAGVSTDAGALSIDEIVQANLRLNIYATDLGGNEVLVASWDPDLNAVVTTNTETLANVAFRVRLNARNGCITGSWTDVDPILLGQAIAAGLTSLSFVNDTDEAHVKGFAVQINNVVYLAMAPAAVGHLGVLTQGQRYHAVYQVQAGNIVLGVYNDSGGVIDPNSSLTASTAFVTGQTTIDQLIQNRSRHYRYVTATTLLDYQYPTALRVLGDGTTPPQVDAPVKTEEYIDLDNFSLTMDSTRTPKIVFAAEETLYLMNVRLKNDTTGDYIDIYFPMKLGKYVQIDCENRRVIDEETGTDVPFIASPSNAAEWLYLQPGSNTFSYTEAGVVNTTFAWSFRSKYS